MDYVKGLKLKFIDKIQQAAWIWEFTNFAVKIRKQCSESNEDVELMKMAVEDQTKGKVEGVVSEQRCKHTQKFYIIL